MKVLLPLFGVDTDDGGRVLGQASHEWALDNIGILNNPTGAMLVDENGNQFPEMTPVEGWHVNIRWLNGDCPAELEQYRVSPVHPKQVWA